MIIVSTTDMHRLSFRRLARDRVCRRASLKSILEASVASEACSAITAGKSGFRIYY